MLQHCTQLCMSCWPFARHAWMTTPIRWLPESSKQPETMSNRVHPAYSAGDVLTRPWQNANVDTWICECFQNSYSMPFIHNRGHNKVVPKRTSNPMVIWVGTWGESLRRGSKTFEVKEIRVAVFRRGNVRRGRHTSHLFCSFPFLGGCPVNSSVSGLEEYRTITFGIQIASWSVGLFIPLLYCP